MSKMRWLLAGALVASVGFPASAAAKPNVRDVAKHVRGADAALDLAQQAAERGNVGELLASLKTERKQARKAERKSTRVGGAKRESRATRKVVRHHDAAFNVFAEIIDEVPAEVQPIVLDALARGAGARDELITRLTELAERVPERARAAIVRVITRMQTDGDLASMVEAMSSDALGDGVKVTLADLFAEVSARLDGILTELEGLVAQLPPQAQEHVQGAIDRLRDQLDEVIAILDGVLGSLPIGDTVCDALDGFPMPIPLCPQG